MNPVFPRKGTTKLKSVGVNTNFDKICTNSKTKPKFVWRRVKVWLCPKCGQESVMLEDVICESAKGKAFCESCCESFEVPE